MTTPTPTPAAVAAAEKLRETLGAMANNCTAPFKVWNDHANGVLEAITILSAPVPVGETPTPRTDEATHDLCGDAEVLSMQRYDHGDWVPADFARQLERELAVAKLELGSQKRRDSFDLQAINRIVADQTAKQSAELTALREQVRALEEDKAQALDCVARFRLLIDAAGLSRLSEAVQLGSISWYHKVNDCMTWAKELLAARAARPASGGEGKL